MAEPIVKIFNEEFLRVKPHVPRRLIRQVTDLEVRLEKLPKQLSNSDLDKEDMMAQLLELAQALQARNFERAEVLQTEIDTDKVAGYRELMVGVKRLVAMCKAAS
jgi:protein transport protein SEC31